MANIDHPMGFVPITNESGTAPKIHYYTAASSETFYQYEPVALNTDGLLTAYTDALGILGTVIGSIAQPLSSTATDRLVAVYDDPDQEYEMQVDDNSLIGGVTDYLGRLFDLVNITSGNATTLQSTCEIDGSSGAQIVGGNAATLYPVRIERVSREIGNDPTAANANYVVRFIQAVMLRRSGGVGGSAVLQQGV